MNILVINSGSSSLKYQMIEIPSEHIVCEGMIERIGQEGSKFTYNLPQDQQTVENTFIKDHKQGLLLLVSYLLHSKIGVLTTTADLTTIAHRVVHGGNVFAKTQIVTASVKSKIKELFSLAPLHNPANLLGIEVCEELFTNATQVAVFDTAFHQTMPAKAYTYALPKKLTDKEQIRVYGFHGTSHKFVSEKATTFLKTTQTKLITLHIGNGASLSAIHNGKCIDHSMGFSPTTGVVMGTRTGDIDPSVLLHLIDNLNYSTKEVSNIINKQSGMLGMTGYSDFRDLFEQASQGNKICKEALELYAYRVKKYIGAYAVAMNGLDAIVFTAGAGENSKELRSMVCQNMDILGIELDEELNSEKKTEDRAINTEKSKVKILVIPTNEELEIAKQASVLLNG